MRLLNKVATATGAGGGFGEGIARRFAAKGARVVVVDLRGDTAERVTTEIGANAIAVTADVSDAADVASVISRTQAAFGTPDILVNNAARPIATSRFWTWTRWSSTACSGST
jgi:3-oxoacyl-[acyl-carrier protein] reductase